MYGWEGNNQTNKFPYRQNIWISVHNSLDQIYETYCLMSTYCG
ncbi:unnamed protein product [Brassica oleracea]